MSTAQPTEPTEPILLADGAKQWGLLLNQDQLALFRQYYRELRAWNERINLTRIVEWEAVQIQHFLDSLSCALVLPQAAQAPPYDVVDIGTGPGFPGIPLKILLPHLHLALIESVGKKTAFLAHLVRILQLPGVEILTIRAEEAAQEAAHRERYDLALSRAVAALPTLAEYALPFVRVGGLFVAMKGQEIEEELAAAIPALDLLGGHVAETRSVQLPGLEHPRTLVVVAKAGPTPSRFPRRPGVPAKRPLG